MDETTRAYFDNMVSKIDGVSKEITFIKEDNKATNNKVNRIETLLIKHISYNKGLDVKVRLEKTEQELAKKASVSGLKWVAGSFFTALSGVVAIIGLIK